MTDDDQPTFERAIELYEAGRLGEALGALRTLLDNEPTNATAWAALGYLERDIGNAAASAAAFDHALALEANSPVALNGRARIALERAEGDVLARYATALAETPGDPRLTLELTEARLERGDDSAIDEFERFAAKRSQWTEGQLAIARMRWESRRDPKFADEIRSLLDADPRRADLWLGLIGLQSDLDRFVEAADAARDARLALGDAPELLLAEAINAGHSGDIERAEELFARLPLAMPGIAGERALHHVRKGNLDLARDDVDRALGLEPGSIRAWAVAELIYRALGDPRSAWLSQQGGLVKLIDLPLDGDFLERITRLLRGLHTTGVQAVGQSVREGTQTRWRLFDRPEPELAELKAALEAAIHDYVRALPPADDRHPLLRHRDSPLAITGSWSVRLTGRGRHVSHFHPLGLIGSACYFIVPEPAADTHEGHLEIGRPPPEFRLPLEPLHVIAPSPGRLVLFPSYLHHGTRPFSAGERLSVAFDVARDPAA